MWANMVVVLVVVWKAAAARSRTSNEHCDMGQIEVRVCLLRS